MGQRSVAFRFTEFEVENLYDSLTLTHRYANTVYSGRASLHASNAPDLHQFAGPYFTRASYTEPSYFQLNWYADSTISYEGYNIDALKINCTSSPQTPQNTWEVAHNYPYHGYFLGDGDVIYVKVRQPAGYKLGLMLWPRSESVDFDLYASATTTLPSSTHHDWYSTRWGTGVELKVIPAWGSVGGGERWIYVALGSYNGQGQFRFQANLHAPYSRVPTVGVDWDPTYQHKKIIRRLLKKTSVAIGCVPRPVEFARTQPPAAPFIDHAA